MARDFNISDDILLPLEGESAAIAIGNEKTAALFYDRVWSPSGIWRGPDRVVPDSVRCFGGTKAEVFKLKDLHRREPDISRINEILREMSSSEVQKVLEEVKQHTRDLKESIPPPKYITLKKLIEAGEYEKAQEMSLGRDVANRLILREISRSFHKKHQTSIVPIYDSEEKRNREYQEGKREVLVSSIQNLGIVYDFALTWEQVLEFRKDKQARKKYRRFIHWLNKEMVGKSQAYIEDEIALKLTDYEESLKKHGIKTFLGTISEILDGKYLLGTSGIVGTFTMAGHPTFGILAGTGLMIGKVALKLSRTLLDFEDIERGPNSEISWVYEAKRLAPHVDVSSQ